MNNATRRAILGPADGQPAMPTIHEAKYQAAVDGGAAFAEQWLAAPGQPSLPEQLAVFLNRMPGGAYQAFQDGFLLRLEQHLRAGSGSERVTSPAPQPEGAETDLPTPLPMIGSEDRRRQAAATLCGLAVRLMLLTGTRPEHWVGARWREFDSADKIWVVPAERTHSGHAQLVPLPGEAVATLAEITRTTEAPGISDWVLASPHDLTQHLDAEALTRRLKALGYCRDGRGPAETVRAELVACGRFGLALIAQHFDGGHAGRPFDLAEHRAMLDCWAYHMTQACPAKIPSAGALTEGLSQLAGWRYA